MYGLVGKIGTYAMMRFTVDTSDQEAAAFQRPQPLAVRAVRRRDHVCRAGDAGHRHRAPDAVGRRRARAWPFTATISTYWARWPPTCARRKWRSCSVSSRIRSAPPPPSTASSPTRICRSARRGQRRQRAHRRARHHRLAAAQHRPGAAPHRVGKLRRCVYRSEKRSGQCAGRRCQAKRFHGSCPPLPSALEAAVPSNHIPVEVFHNLIETYRKHLPVVAPLLASAPARPGL